MPERWLYRIYCLVLTLTIASLGKNVEGSDVADNKAGQQAVDKDPSLFAFYNCTGRYDVATDGTICSCNSTYDLSIYNISTWTWSVFGDISLKDMEPYLAKIKPFPSVIYYELCRYVKAPCDCQFVIPEVQVPSSQYGVADAAWAYQGCHGPYPATKKDSGSAVSKSTEFTVCVCDTSYDYNMFQHTGMKEIKVKQLTWEDCMKSAICDCVQPQDPPAASVNSAPSSSIISSWLLPAKLVLICYLLLPLYFIV